MSGNYPTRPDTRLTEVLDRSEQAPLVVALSEQPQGNSLASGVTLGLLRHRNQSVHIDEFRKIQTSFTDAT
jgi:hypothetical protein